jgi:hypothetical protein
MTIHGPTRNAPTAARRGIILTNASRRMAIRNRRNLPNPPNLKIPNPSHLMTATTSVSCLELPNKTLKTFTMVAQQLKEELSDSEDDVAPSHFQHNFAMREEPTGVETLDYTFKQSTPTDLDLRKVVILLHS